MKKRVRFTAFAVGFLLILCTGGAFAGMFSGGGGGGGSMTYPGAGIAKSTGSAWDTSYGVGTLTNTYLCTWTTVSGFVCNTNPASFLTAESDPIVKAINGVVCANGTTISACTSIPNGMTATTQAAGSNDTKIATDAYVDTGLATKAPTANPTIAGAVKITPIGSAPSGLTVTPRGTNDGVTLGFKITGRDITANQTMATAEVTTTHGSTFTHCDGITTTAVITWTALSGAVDYDVYLTTGSGYTVGRVKTGATGTSWTYDCSAGTTVLIPSVDRTGGVAGAPSRGMQVYASATLQAAPFTTGAYIWLQGAYVATLPAGVANYWFAAQTTSVSQPSVKPASGEHFILDGVTLSADHKATAPAGTGALLGCKHDGTTWWCTSGGAQGPWTDGGV